MENDTIMTPELVDSLLDDMGFETREVREATKKHCLGMLDVGDITWGNLGLSASSYADGYVDCLIIHG